MHAVTASLRLQKSLVLLGRTGTEDPNFYDPPGGDEMGSELRTQQSLVRLIGGRTIRGLRAQKAYPQNRQLGELVLLDDKSRLIHAEGRKDLSAAPATAVAVCRD